MTIALSENLDVTEAELSRNDAILPSRIASGQFHLPPSSTFRWLLATYKGFAFRSHDDLFDAALDDISADHTCYNEHCDKVNRQPDSTRRAHAARVAIELRTFAMPSYHLRER